MKKNPLENEVRNLMKKGHVPGVSIVIIENAGVESHYEYGLKNSEMSDLIDDDTVFEADSLSKPVFRCPGDWVGGFNN